jgi:ribosomal protein S18 acetylase RimI-like enzyme
MHQALTDRDLYLRGIETVLASWEVYALGALDAAVIHLPGVSAAVFPEEPERQIYNNAVLRSDVESAGRADALVAMEATYEAAGVARFAGWVHENDHAMCADLERRGYSLVEYTRAMGVALDDIRIPRPDVDLGSSDWEEHRRILGLSSLAGADPSAFHILVAQLEGESVATAIALDHERDCGIYNVGTVEAARRRGLATALTAHHLHDALARGCSTASVQSTPNAERVYAAVGFRDLGRILEYVPGWALADAAPGEWM